MRNTNSIQLKIMRPKLHSLLKLFPNNVVSSARHNKNLNYQYPSQLRAPIYKVLQRTKPQKKMRN